MGRLVLFVLMWGAVLTEEYGIGGMPQYGGSGDYGDTAAGLQPLDYTGHSPDAPAPLDYKYVEDSHGNSDKYSKEVEVSDQWQKPKKRRPNRLDKDDIDAMEPTHFIKHRSNHRPRFKSRVKKSRSNEPHRRRRILPDRPPDDNIDDETNQYRDEVKQEARDVIEHIDTVTTERIIRRKPRDRRLDFSDKRSDSDEDEFVELNTKPKEVERFVPDYSHVTSKRRGRPPPPPDDEDFDDENVNFKQPKAPRIKPDKNLREYNDYYDMNRVYNIKNRLPLLIRRTSTRTPVSPSEDRPSYRIVSEGRPSLPSKDLMDFLAGARRAGSDVSNPETMVRPTTEEKPRLFIDVTQSTATEIETSSGSTSTISAVQFVTEITTASTSIIPSTSTQESFQQTVSHILPKDLSIAEKSRLSILKKAQRKEKDKPILSTKPPVLLQVTNRLHTVVMVEPRDDNPWMRAKEVSDDSPEQLEKVKRLMRNKIVSQAKDIKDLTDNWNDMVCDYIDTSLLESRSSKDRANWVLLVVYCLLNIFYVTFYSV